MESGILESFFVKPYVILLFTSSKDALNLQFQNSNSCKFANFTCNLLRKKGALATIA